jgi:hypothetical protein
MPMSGSCAFGCSCAGLHIANGGSNLQFSFVVRTLDELPADSVRGANWPDCLGYRAHKIRFCRRPPFHDIGAFALMRALPASRHAGICGDHAGCQRSIWDQPRPCSLITRRIQGLLV